MFVVHGLALLILTSTCPFCGVQKESKETKTKVVPEEPEDDPDLKLLRELALAMNLVPAIYKGFGTMSIEEKKEALRERYLGISLIENASSSA